MPFNKLNISGAKADVLAWINHGLTLEEENMLRNVSRLPCLFKHVALMPDAHLGKGSMVGSVLATKDAVIPATVGVDIGCFTGETLVPLLDGKSYPIKELAECKEEVVVYACTPSGKVVAAKATVKKTRSKAKLVKVILDNGEEVRCTPDHQFMLRDGSFAEAKDLKMGESLMPLYRKTDKDGYVLVQQNYSGRWQKAHWIVGRSGLLGKVPRFEVQKTVIHHKNFVESDNRPENLEFMSESAHSAYHRSLVERNEHWQSAEFEAKRVNALSEKAKTQEGHAYYAERGTKNILKYMEGNPEHFKMSVAENGQRGKQYLISYNQSEKGRAKSKEIANRLYLCETCGEKVKSGIGLHNHRFLGHGYNHKVVKVIELNETEDVYCLTVPEHHNFGLEAGVFVHNCGMMAVKTPFNSAILEGKLRDLRLKIEETIPTGFNSYKESVDEASRWKGWDSFKELHPKVQQLSAKSMKQLGTLGSGNHFIEICLDTEDNVWLMLHSGSRNIGKELAERHIATAKSLHRLNELPSPDLAYFIQGTEEFTNYWNDLAWAQGYAMKNREVMMNRLLKVFNKMFNKGKAFRPEITVNCHHNYCIPDTEIIPTPMGPKRISQLKIGSKVYAFDENDGLIETKVVGKVYSGKKKIYTINTSNRSIRVSGEHPILTISVNSLPHPQRNWHEKRVGNFEWKKASEIKKRDIIVCSKGYYTKTGKNHSPDKARFIGAFLGDGWLRQKTKQGYTVGLAIGGKDEVITKKYFNLVQTNLFPEANWHNNVAGAFGLTCSSKQVYEQILKFGIGQKSRDKSVPDYCFKWSLFERKQLLAGYFDADGCIMKSGGKVASASEILVEGLRELAISCGLHCTRISFSQRTTNYGENPLFSFYINSTGLSELDIWHESKVNKISTPEILKIEMNKKKLGYISLPNNFYAQYVREIKVSHEIEDVYDIEVDSKNHSFICEGIVVHNCALEQHYGEEVFITRKGAINAEEGRYGIIPGSMGAKSFIIKGLGAPESFNSCSHGAGRKMSRTKAKQKYTKEDLAHQTKGVECRKDAGVIDEIPAAYKDIDEVMRNQSDLVEVVAEIKQVICVKG